MFASLTQAQTNKVAAMRELRITCLETFNTTHERLEELRSFVEQQTGRQRAAADQLFQLRQSVASANRRILDLQQKRTTTQTGFEQARIAIDRAVTSYQAAGQVLPRGEPWADDGAKALTELRRAADATPRDQWKHLRVKETEAQFTTMVHDWRAARREFERAGFDLELRAAGVIFNRISNQQATASTELESLATLLTNRETAITLLTTNSAQWSKIIKDLNQGNAEARKRLAKVAFDFHLVDLKFTAWRLNQAGLAEEGVSSLPDILERQIEHEFMPSSVTPIGFSSRSVRAGDNDSLNAAGGAPAIEGAGSTSAEEAKETDPKFRELLERVTVALGRLQFLTEAWNRESSNVQAALNAVESSEDQTKELVDEAANLAAELESLRRSTENSKLNLTAGLATIDLVQKRFAGELENVNRLLTDATSRTAQLQKSLELP
jgi:chromosome segregation ATPase